MLECLWKNCACDKTLSVQYMVRDKNHAALDLKHSAHGDRFLCFDVGAGGRILARLSQLQFSGVWSLELLQNPAAQNARALSAALAAPCLTDSGTNGHAASGMCPSGKPFLNCGISSYSPNTQEEEEEDYVQPKPFDALKPTFSSLELVDYEGDFEERLEKEPIMIEVKPAPEPPKVPFVSLWRRFIEEEELTDFTNLEAIRAVAQKNPHAQTLVDITCEKVSTGLTCQLFPV